MDRGYGVLLLVGLLLGVAAGIALGEPSAGAVIGLGSGALLAVALRARG
ncbi:MAG: hypothetical protein ACK4MT_01775 [Thermaurantiacus tibetensis]|nr:hypothetical protein [Thermaurantiacus tibetensis]